MCWLGEHDVGEGVFPKVEKLGQRAVQLGCGKGDGEFVMRNCLTDFGSGGVVFAGDGEDGVVVLWWCGDDGAGGEFVKEDFCRVGAGSCGQHGGVEQWAEVAVSTNWLFRVKTGFGKGNSQAAFGAVVCGEDGAGGGQLAQQVV